MSDELLTEECGKDEDQEVDFQVAGGDGGR
jgi:hypothetical protein